MLLQNNHFSFYRLFLLYRKSFIENKRKSLVYVGGVIAGTTILINLFIYTLTRGFCKFDKWDKADQYAFFIVSSIILGMYYISKAFPAFRSKEKSLSYLTLPVSTLEKFTFEFINRIVLFVLIFPFLYWAILNLSGIVLHEIYPEFEHYRFEFITIFNKFKNQGHFLILSILSLFFMTIPFLGASHFQKRTLLKTLFYTVIILAIIGLFIYILSYFLSSDNFIFANNSFQLNFSFTNSKNSSWINTLFYYTITIAPHLIILCASYFKLKEKEV